MSDRIVVLVDMDCFYCQVEQRINPDLKGKPVAVVQYNKWRGGGIIAVNYEARAQGVTRNMRGDEAKGKCPDINLVHVPSNNEKADISKYRDAGKEVINVICQFSASVQRASIDEAFLDLTEAVDKRMAADTQVSLDHLHTSFVVGFESQLDDVELGRQESVKEWLQRVSLSANQHDKRLVVAAKLVEEMRAAVFSQTGFTCSAGVAHNKILSKLVCGLHKPNRQTVLPISKVPFLYQTLPVKKVRHLGGKLGDILKERLAITFMYELEKFSEAELCQKFDQKNGQWLYNIARGIDNEAVEARLIPKSIGCCKRFPGKTALKTKQEVEHWINELASEVTTRLEKDYEENCRRPRNIIVQWSSEIGSTISKTGFLSHYDQPSIYNEAMLLLNKCLVIESNHLNPFVQFLGVNVGKFTEEPNKAHSIAKFFKAAAPTESDLGSKNAPGSSKPKVVEEKPNVNQDAKISSFFLRYAKNKALNPSPKKTPTLEESTKERIIEEELTEEKVEELAPASEEEEECQSEKNEPDEKPDDFVVMPSQEANSEAPCPQCGKMLSIFSMSEHLDHHVAEDLHKELNRGAGPSVVSQIQPSSSAAVKGKRKYTKSNAKSQSESKKTRSIQSFFTQK